MYLSVHTTNIISVPFSPALNYSNTCGAYEGHVRDHVGHMRDHVGHVGDHVGHMGHMRAI